MYFGKTPRRSRNDAKNERLSCSHRSSSRNPSLNLTRKQPGIECDTRDKMVLGKEEFRRLEQIVLCKVCFDRDSCMILFPCRHMATCEYCTSHLMRCAICRAPIKERVKINYN